MLKSRGFIYAGLIARMEGGRSAFKILTGKPTGKRPLGRPRSRREDNIRYDTRKWIDSAQDRDYYRAFVNVILNLLYP